MSGNGYGGGDMKPKFSVGGTQQAGPNPSGNEDLLRRLEEMLRDVGYGGGLGALFQGVIGSGILPGRGGDAINGGGSNGGGGGGGCLAGETLIRMADGSEKRADEIRVDDEIMGLDFDLGSTPQTVSCTNSSRQMCFRVKLSNGLSLEASSSHRWFVGEKGLALTPQLAPGDLLIGEGADAVNVLSIERIGPKVVHWWNCEPNHCYFAGGVLHHNIIPNYQKGGTYSNPWGTYYQSQHAPTGGAGAGSE